MLELVRTNSEHKDFIDLVNQLNNYLKTIDGEEHEFYMQYNGINTLNNVVIIFLNKIPVGCGAFKKFDHKSVEIKRMYTPPEHRNKNIASQVLSELETWAKELGYGFCILETGKRQVEAVNFYKKNNYRIIGNFGQYISIENSICFQKDLNK